MKKTIVALIVLVTSVFKVSADEGMWMLHNIDSRTAAVMKELGLKLTPQQLYSTDGPSLKDAVVNFGGFCSGVVVSPNGLVFTNHHCGYGAIQQLSTPEDDILAKGFVARSYAEERPAEDLFVAFLERTEDCTEQVKQAMQGLDNEKLDSVLQAVEKTYSETYPDRYCEVKSYYTDNAFYASVYKMYTDIRLVFTATETLGKFGGDTDNWMWPRQTCDFSVFRIYADANGEPSDYCDTNVPLQTPNYAPVSIDGYRPGDFCMTVGYPGSTERYLSSWGIYENVNAINISRIDVRGKKQEVWKRWMDSDRAIAIQYASKWAGSSNYWKNSIGMNQAVADLDIIGEKQKLEEQIRTWYNADEALKTRFGTMLDELKEAYGQRFDIVRAMGFFDETFRRGIELRRIGALLDALPHDADSTELASCRSELESFFKDYDARVDEEVMTTLLQNYRNQVDELFWPAFYQTIDSVYGGDTQQAVHDLFAHTILTNADCLNQVLADSTLLDQDPGMRYVRDVQEKFMELRALLSGTSSVIDYNEHLLTQAILERDQERPHYSDANFSMRLSYGYIQDYSANGNHYDYYTNSQSLLDKAAQQAEIPDYQLEEDIVRLLKKKHFGKYADRSTGDLHLCFLSNNDITGGNSGSPMFNGEGKLIGLAFDGNWEALSGDISFNSELQRCIGVDIRFVLYLIDRWGKASHLIKELGI